MPRQSNTQRKIKYGLPSGKRLHNYGKSPFSMGKSTISMAMEKIGYGKSPVFYERKVCAKLASAAMLNSQRVKKSR